MGPSQIGAAPLPALPLKPLSLNPALSLNNNAVLGKVTFTAPAGGNTGDAVPVVPVPTGGSWQDDPASLPFDRSAFNQMVAQFVNEPAALPAESVPAPRISAKLPVPAVVQQPEAPAGTLVQALPVRGETPEGLTMPTGTRRKETATVPAVKSSPAQPPAIPVEVAVPLPVPARLQLPQLKTGGSEEKTVRAMSTSSAERPEPVVQAPKPLLEVKINLNPEVPQPHYAQVGPPPVRERSSVSSPAAIASEDHTPQSANGQKQHSGGNESSSQQNADHLPPDLASDNRATAPSTVRLATPVVATVVAQVTATTAAPVLNQAVPVALNPAATVPVVQPPAQPLPSDTPTPAREPTASAQAATALREELPIDRNKPQPAMRSLSLEFTPDGSHDIKLRLSERGGDVHISVHGTDVSLTGRLREGVCDLVGTLSRAGYDAQAWTPDQGRQNQRPPQEQRKARRDSGDSTAEEFSGILQQPIQEIS